MEAIKSKHSSSWLLHIIKLYTQTHSQKKSWHVGCNKKNPAPTLSNMHNGYANMCNMHNNPNKNVKCEMKESREGERM